MTSLVGRAVHVSGPSPRGWDGHARLLTGTTYVITDSHGVRHHVDSSRRRVVEL